MSGFLDASVLVESCLSRSKKFKEADALHAEVARKLGCSRIHTLNPSHFRHVVPDLEIVPL